VRRPCSWASLTSHVLLESLLTHFKEGACNIPPEYLIEFESIFQSLRACNFLSSFLVLMLNLLFG
jgi:hypothetical protein